MGMKQKINKAFKIGNKSNRSLHYETQQSHNRFHFEPRISSSQHGNRASDWSASPQSPPQDVSGTKIWVN